MGDPYRYKPHNVFTVMGHCWVLEDEFNYPINPNLRNSAQVHNTMRVEWDYFSMNMRCFMMRRSIISYKCLGDSRRKFQETL